MSARVFELGSVVLQCGVTLPNAKLAYATYGELNAARDNAVLMPTFFGGKHTDAAPMLARGRARSAEALHHRPEHARERPLLLAEQRGSPL